MGIEPQTAVRIVRPGGLVPVELTGVHLPHEDVPYVSFSTALELNDVSGVSVEAVEEKNEHLLSMG